MAVGLAGVVPPSPPPPPRSIGIIVLARKCKNDLWGTITCGQNLDVKELTGANLTDDGPKRDDVIPAHRCGLHHDRASSMCRTRSDVTHSGCGNSSSIKLERPCGLIVLWSQIRSLVTNRQCGISELEDAYGNSIFRFSNSPSLHANGYQAHGPCGLHVGRIQLHVTTGQRAKCAQSIEWHDEASHASAARGAMDGRQHSVVSGLDGRRLSALAGGVPIVPGFVVPTLRLRSGQVPSKTATDEAASVVVVHARASPRPLSCFYDIDANAGI